jgi:sterol 3beta-glucosyltransferase
MRIVVVTIGSRGDVQPYINLSQGLLAAGHTVTLATNPTLCPLADSHGVPSIPVGPAVDMGEVGARLVDQSFNNMWIGMICVMQFGANLVEEAFPAVLEACRDADLVVTSDTGSGIAEAEKLGLPWISVTLQPARVPKTNESNSLIGRALWTVLGRLMIAPTNRFRKRVGAPPVHDIATMLSRRLILLPVSRHVAPPDPRWPAHVRQTGYWFARPRDVWEPPSALIDFLNRGEQPIAVSLGVMSLSGKKARESAQIVLRALDRANVRAVVQGWDDILRDLPVPPTVFCAGPLPHSWLFNQVSMVIHHGGFGTTAAALRAGVPAVIVPHVIDQFYWGHEVHRLGVGPENISRGKLNADNLSRAILQVRQDSGMREKALDLGKRIQAEPDGVADAVRILEKIR